MARRDRGLEGEVVAERLVQAGWVLIEVIERPEVVLFDEEVFERQAVVLVEQYLPLQVECPLALAVESYARRHERWISKRKRPKREQPKREQQEQQPDPIVTSRTSPFMEGRTRGA